MSKQRTDTPAEPTAVPAEQPAGEGAPVVLTEPGPPARRFRDTRYLSRTLVLEDGRTAPVVDSEIATSDPAWLEYLQQSPEFEPLE